MKEIPISEFRVKCSAFLKLVQKTKKPICITRFGKPVAEIIPLPPKRSTPWIGSMKGQIEIIGDIVAPAVEESEWEALRSEIQRGGDQADHGRFVDGRKTFAKIRNQSSLRRRNKD